MSVKRRRSAEKWILDRSTLRRIGERTNKSHVNHWRLAQRYVEHIPPPLSHFCRNSKRATGVLLLDGKHKRILGKDYCIHIAYDTGIGVLDYWIDVTENKTAYSYLMQRLDKVGYKPLCVVGDGHGGIMSVVQERNLPYQRCIFHILKELRDKLTVGREFKSKKDKLLFSRIKWIIKTKRIEYLPAKIDLFRRFENAFDGRKAVFKWFWSIVPDAVLHLSFESGQVPNTSNEIERLNGQIEARLKTFRGIKSERSLNKLLKILLYFKGRK